jgi:hypothetical protein
MGAGLMARIDWPLHNGMPCIEVVLALMPGHQPLPRTLLADTGAGSIKSGFELILEEDDCILCGGIALATGVLGGAYTGAFPIYALNVRVPALGFAGDLRAVGVPSVPTGFDGIACFRFLNRFHYGNFGSAAAFGLQS